METQLLRDKLIYPSPEVLENAMKDSFLAFEKMRKTLANPEFDFVENWHYYNDGKSWLCKVSHKKKTIFWLSVWDGFFKTTFYFTERNSEGVINLELNNELKERFLNQDYKGKLIPLTVAISNMENIKDLFVLCEYKKKLK